MSGHYTKIACDSCGDMYEILNTVTDEVGDRFVCNRCLRALVQERLNEPETTTPASTDFTPDAAEIGQWHDFIAMNANEVVFDPTPEESDRILRESVVEFTGCEKSSPEEVELDNDLIADLKQQLDTALADLENEQSLRRVLLRTTRFWQRQAVDDAVRIAKLIAAPWYVRLRRWARRQWEYDIYA